MKNIFSALIIFSQVVLVEGGLWTFLYPLANDGFRIGFTYTYLL